MKTLVIGVGNILLGDDGIGVHAVRELMKHQLLKNVTVVDGGTLGIELINYYIGYERLIILDALQVDAPPGTIVRINGVDIQSKGFVPASAHDSTLTDILYFTSSFIPLAQVTILGVVPDSTSFLSLSLSECVNNALPKLIELVLSELVDKDVSINS
ncbi:MAG: hydrogenase maturation protease [Ignavibacteriae bacterium]|nr:hydrogenase maturation protease [Ignavibacteriota bacterium]